MTHVQDLIERLQECKRDQREICQELTVMLIKSPDLMAGLKEGLIKPNFPVFTPMMNKASKKNGY